MKPIAVYHEHPDWFRPLFAALRRRDVPHVAVAAAAHSFDPDERESPFALVFNRASPSAYTRGHAGTTFHTGSWLAHLERIGVPVVNGSHAYALEISKARQLDLLQASGARHPRSRVVNSQAGASHAAHALRFPILVKANVGGSGAGIVRFDTQSALDAAVERHGLDLGLDGSAIVQELAPPRGACIYRVEVLGGRFLYAIRVYPDDSFNLCPADACRDASGGELVRGACALDAPRNGMRVEAFTPSPEIALLAKRIAHLAQLDVGGIEYLIDDRDGEPSFYDVNALSNFVADPMRVLGFDPFERLVDYLVARARGEDGRS
jgi:glutathione synthase/RimK-type ligase-like ATP-grasp enzyme